MRHDPFKARDTAWQHAAARSNARSNARATLSHLAGYAEIGALEELGSEEIGYGDLEIGYSDLEIGAGSMTLNADGTVTDSGGRVFYDGVYGPATQDSSGVIKDPNGDVIWDPSSGKSTMVLGSSDIEIGDWADIMSAAGGLAQKTVQDVQSHQQSSQTASQAAANLSDAEQADIKYATAAAIAAGSAKTKSTDQAAADQAAADLAQQQDAAAISKLSDDQLKTRNTALQSDLSDAITQLQKNPGAPYAKALVDAYKKLLSMGGSDPSLATKAKEAMGHPSAGGWSTGAKVAAGVGLLAAVGFGVKKFILKR